MGGGTKEINPRSYTGEHTTKHITWNLVILYFVIFCKWIKLHCHFMLYSMAIHQMSFMKFSLSSIYLAYWLLVVYLLMCWFTYWFFLMILTRWICIEWMFLFYSHVLFHSWWLVIDLWYWFVNYYYLFDMLYIYIIWIKLYNFNCLRFIWSWWNGFIFI